MTGFGLETLPRALRLMGALFVWFGFIAATTFVTGEVAPFALAAQFVFLFAFAAALTALLLRRYGKPVFAAR